VVILGKEGGGLNGGENHSCKAANRLKNAAWKRVLPGGGKGKSLWVVKYNSSGAPVCEMGVDQPRQKVEKHATRKGGPLLW